MWVYHAMIKEMAMKAIFILYIVLDSCSSLQCPTSFLPVDNLDALGGASINLYLDESDFDGAFSQRVNLISSSVVNFPFNSLELLQFVSGSATIPASITNATLHLLLESGENEVFFSIGLWSLNDSLASAGCVEPGLDTIAPGQDIGINVSLPCTDNGLVYMQLCLTLGTEPYTLLNGTYQTFTMYFPRTCEGETVGVCYVDNPSEILPAELCVTMNQTIELVNFGAGGWSLLVGIFDSNDSPDEIDRGYCFVTRHRSNGLNSLVTDGNNSRMFYIPLEFDGLDISMQRSPELSNTVISYAVSLKSGDTDILNDPTLSIPETGLLLQDRLEFTVAMPCKESGFVRMNMSFNSTAVVNELFYRRDFNFFFYRNCTPDGSSRQMTPREVLTLKVVTPIMVFLLAVTVTVVVVALLLLTRKQKRRHYELEIQLEMSKLPTSNAYISSTFVSPFTFLEPYQMEYNFASLEVVDELGQGAFGRVFKARAPGITRGDFIPQEFVAVKLLKEEAGSDIMDDFCKEVKVCVQFEHVNVIRLVGVCTATSKKCMIFEFMDLGNLGELLRFSDPESPTYPGANSHHKLITTDHFLSVVVQIANGLVYLATLNFVHRDIAARNCLIDSNFTVKIADFGMSRDVSNMDYYRIGSSKACLPLRWMPPEALLYGKFTLKSDVWSFGVVMWEVYTFGRQPHSGISNYEVIDRIKTGQLLECPAHCPTSIFDIMRKCWSRSPAKRVTIHAVYNRLSHLADVDGHSDARHDEAYLNLAFADTVSEEEIKENNNVQEILKKNREKELADIAELLESSDDETEENAHPSAPPT